MSAQQIFRPTHPLVQNSYWWVLNRTTIMLEGECSTSQHKLPVHSPIVANFTMVSSQLNNHNAWRWVLNKFLGPFTHWYKIGNGEYSMEEPKMAEGEYSTYVFSSLTHCYKIANGEYSPNTQNYDYWLNISFQFTHPMVQNSYWWVLNRTIILLEGECST